MQQCTCMSPDNCTGDVHDLKACACLLTEQRAPCHQRYTVTPQVGPGSFTVMLSSLLTARSVAADATCLGDLLSPEWWADRGWRPPPLPPYSECKHGSPWRSAWQCERGRLTYLLKLMLHITEVEDVHMSTNCMHSLMYPGWLHVVLQV